MTNNELLIDYCTVLYCTVPPRLVLTTWCRALLSAVYSIITIITAAVPHEKQTHAMQKKGITLLMHTYIYTHTVYDSTVINRCHYPMCVY